jgi:hypothetical protein
MRKKASLNLSMNAIVVLILAITMLGLGLTFMRGLFKQATERVTEAVSSQELTNPPTRDNPLTAAPGEASFRDTKKQKILLAFMNPEAGAKYCQLGIEDSTGNDVSIGCSSSCATDKIGIFNDAVSSSALDPDQINVWTLVIDGSTISTTSWGSETSKTYVLSANMCCKTSIANSIDCAGTGVTQYKKDILITVKK